ncbi:MAG TPA: DUF1876 domain-containing protein [Acidimicrobiales bacterium]|nr:DUF1876 domain-containing protein [Acidimicrobiales bacterium]
MKETVDIKLWFKEDADHTEARATLIIHGTAFTGAGQARRNPADANQPVIGEELAAARALSDLAHKLLDAAAEAISEREGAPVHLYD